MTYAFHQLSRRKHLASLSVIIAAIAVGSVAAAACTGRWPRDRWSTRTRPLRQRVSPTLFGKRLKLFSGRL